MPNFSELIHFSSQNPAGLANLEIVGLDREQVAESVYEWAIQSSLAKLPERFPGLQIAFPEDLAPFQSLIETYQLKLHYSLYELTVATFSKNPDTNIPLYEDTFLM